jgi:uncharacterized PurR-regulated membrane protein YhhQ (DUF165 family)
MTKRTTAAALLGALFLTCILAANYVTTEYGLIPVGFGLTATAGTYFAGATFILRDSIQDLAGKYAVLALIILGAVLSWLKAQTTTPGFLPPGVTGTSIAIASGIAFLCSETADLLVYTPLRARGYLRAALASNTIGTIVDTILFLWISGFGVDAAVRGQVVGKLAVTAVAAALLLTYRTSRRTVTA